MAEIKVFMPHFPCPTHIVIEIVLDQDVERPPNWPEVDLILACPGDFNKWNWACRIPVNRSDPRLPGGKTLRLEAHISAWEAHDAEEHVRKQFVPGTEFSVWDAHQVGYGRVIGPVCRPI